ncbi:MAG: hypothetical protein V4454_19960 [Pseudomonadota bacterium]
MRTRTDFWLPALLVLSALLAACEQKPAPVATSLPARIASVDAAGVKGESDAETVRARKALAAAAQACKVTELEVTEMMAKSRKVLSGEGKAMVMVELLEATPGLVADTTVDASTCQKLFAAYTVARQGGQNHQAAVAGLKIRP